MKAKNCEFGRSFCCKACVNKYWKKRNQRPEVKLANRKRMCDWRDNNPGYMARKMREYRAANPGRSAELSRDTRKNHPDRTRARGIAKKAIQSGKLVRPDVCPVCTISPFPEAHHENYENPLDVTWACKTCHGKLHRLGDDEFRS